MNEKAKVILLSSVIAIVPATLTAIATTIATVKGTKNEVQKASQRAEKLTDQLEDVSEQLRGVPVGTVIAWWGNWSVPRDRPNGFELCDGSNVATTGSHISGQRKPDLRNRFIKGATENNWDVVQSNRTGGTPRHQGLRVEGVQLTVPQMPPHAHGVKTSGDAAHAHSTLGSAASDDGGDSADSHFALGDHKDARNWPGIKVAGGNHQHDIRTEGAGQTHDHPIPEINNEPPYVEILYLIKVK